jgi:peptidoglycan/xylan/chitin deacetylase (PgdA/CDA1 family)
MAMESLYEYGSRAGFWRLHRLFTERGVPVTVFGVAAAMEEPAAVEAMLKADWEVASHGYRWIDTINTCPRRWSASICQGHRDPHSLTGSRPLGWYQGAPAPTPRGWWRGGASTMPILCRRCALLG